MRRPIIIATASYAGGIYCLSELRDCKLLIAVVILIIAAAGSIGVLAKDKAGRAKTVQMGICFFMVGLIVCQCSLYTLANNGPGNVSINGEDMSIRGVVKEIEKKGKDRCGAVISVADITGKWRVQVDIYGKTNNWEDLAGREVKLTGKVKRPDKRRNPGVFDYEKYLRTKRICYVAEANAASIKRGEVVDPLRHYAAGLRESFGVEMKKHMSDEDVSLLAGILFGDKDEMDENVYESFQRNGTAHVLAVSGLHVGMVYGLLAFLWRGKKKTGFIVIMSGVLMFYALLGDFSPSVVRAAVMIILHMISSAMHRPFDITCAAAFTALTMLAVSPLLLFNCGFIMSFLAIFILAAMIRKVRGGAGVIKRKVAPVLGLQATMTPFTSFTFNYFSPGAFVANFPVVLIAGVIVPIGIGMLCIWALFSGTKMAIWCMATGGEILERLIGSMKYINGVVYNKGSFSFDVVSPSVALIWLFYLFLFLFLSEWTTVVVSRKMWRHVAAAAVFICVSCFIAAYPAKNSFSQAGIVFVDVGQGDCIHIKTDDGKNILIDGGGSSFHNVGEKTLKPYLLKNGVRKVDLAIVTHLHTDHFQGIRALCQDGMVKKLAVYESNKFNRARLAEEVKMDEGSIYYVSSGTEFGPWGQISAEVIFPYKKSEDQYMAMGEEDENSSCLIIQVRYKGKKILVTGDIDSNGENELIKAWGYSKLKTDILKVPHHGSKYSSSESFIRMTAPDIAVFQVGKNTFGHPSPQIVKRYSEAGAQIYRNDIHGAIGLVIDSGKTKIVKMDPQR